MYTCFGAATCSGFHYSSPLWSHCVIWPRWRPTPSHHFLRLSWKAPRKRQKSDAKIADLKIEKYVYGHVRKHQLDPIDDFNPRPPEFRGKLQSHLHDFLEKVKGKGLGISVLSDLSTQWYYFCWINRVSQQTKFSRKGISVHWKSPFVRGKYTRDREKYKRAA